MLKCGASATRLVKHMQVFRRRFPGHGWSRTLAMSCAMPSLPSSAPRSSRTTTRSCTAVLYGTPPCRTAKAAAHGWPWLFPRGHDSHQVEQALTRPAYGNVEPAAGLPQQWVVVGAGYGGWGSEPRAPAPSTRHRPLCARRPPVRPSAWGWAGCASAPRGHTAPTWPPSHLASPKF